MKKSQCPDFFNLCYVNGIKNSNKDYMYFNIDKIKTYQSEIISKKKERELTR